MTALNRTPQNTNYLQPTKYLLTFDRIGAVQYFCQEINIPGVNLGQTSSPTPLYDLPIVGNKVNYNSLDIGFTVDEAMVSWKNLHDWFRAIASPKSFADRNTLTTIQNAYKSSSLTSYSDATLTILSALNNPIVRIQFYNVFPISLSDIKFDTKESADEIITGQASFAFEYFDFIT